MTIIQCIFSYEFLNINIVCRLYWFFVIIYFFLIFCWIYNFPSSAPTHFNIRFLCVLHDTVNFRVNDYLKRWGSINDVFWVMTVVVWAAGTIKSVGMRLGGHCDVAVLCSVRTPTSFSHANSCSPILPLTTRRSVMFGFLFLCRFSLWGSNRDERRTTFAAVRSRRYTYLLVLRLLTWSTRNRLSVVCKARVPFKTNEIPEYSALLYSLSCFVSIF